MKELGGRLLTYFGTLNGRPRMLRNAGFKMEFGKPRQKEYRTYMCLTSRSSVSRLVPPFHWVELYVFNSNPRWHFLQGFKTYEQHAIRNGRVKGAKLPHGEEKQVIAKYIDDISSMIEGWL